MKNKMKFKHDVYDMDSENLNAEEVTEESAKNSNVIIDDYSKHIVLSAGVKVIMICLIVYIVFLIIGSLSTEYYIDNEGNNQAIIADLDMLADRDDYDKLEMYIKDVRTIMTDITLLDIKLSNGELSNSQASIQYKNILDNDVDKLIPKIETLNVKTRNEHIRQNLLVILSNDIAFYLQYMSSGLQLQNSQNIEAAVQWKSSMLITYGSIMDDMKKLAESLHRENSSFFEWELESAVNKKGKVPVLRSDEDE